MTKNRKNYTGFLFFTILFLSLTLVTTLSGFNFNQENYKVGFEIRPQNNNYVCTFKITELNSGKILSNPKVLCNSGQKASISIDGEDLTVHADVLVMNDINSIDYNITLLKDSKEVFKQNSSINLK